MNLGELLRADERWSRQLSITERSRGLRTAAAIFAHSGDSWFWLPGLGLIWYFGDPAQKDWSLRLIVAVIALALIVTLLKFAIRRRRPAGTWGSIYRATDPHSFPSGHAARVGLLAFLITAWGPSWLIPIILPWALLVSLARVALGLHYLSDVLAGMLLGLLMGALALSIMPA